MGRLFTVKHGPALWGYIAGALAVSVVFFVLLQAVPGRFRKPLISLVTFFAGLFYVTEFFYPVGADGKNFLTAYRAPVAQINQVLQGLAIGAGISSLVGVHARAIARKREGWGFSVALFACLVGIAVTGLLKEYRPNGYNRAAFSLFFDGGLINLESAMFSIVSFYIVSAAYRAFRARSVEATILLVAAFLVMLGQISLGQALTSGLPLTGFWANFRVEIIRDWILTRLNSPAILAVELGLGIGVLSTSIRLWLSLERGSYFDKEV